ncbi:hypothetical protein J4Q44_G00049920 [Coregonus suidteri]|uniref:Uncharacterized protein n=1 Tax=Coregonus suidteri TaxID=861788 RepID=A0AAN8M667_9TELE
MTSRLHNIEAHNIMVRIMRSWSDSGHNYDQLVAWQSEKYIIFWSVKMCFNQFATRIRCHKNTSFQPGFAHWVGYHCKQAYTVVVICFQVDNVSAFEVSAAY